MEWNSEEIRLLASLKNPSDIQAFLDNIPYSTDEFYRCPRRVLKERQAHCFDGALFAAAALRYLGHAPLLIDLFAVRDDDHLLAIFKKDGLWGAVAKSNFVGLRYREPIHRSLRELVMTYFEGYYNVDGEKTLRSYTAPLDLAKFDHLQWITEDAGLEHIADRLDRQRRYELITDKQASQLQAMDRRSYESGLFGSDPAGLYNPREKK